MPISSYLGNRSRGTGGGWARSFLPTTTPTTPTKSKLPRKSRRRAQLRDFIWAHFFTIGLSLSLLLFTAAFFRFGPFSLSSPRFSRRHSTTRPRKPNLRKLPSASHNDVVSSAAAVDITTKDLYEKIEFSDVDGGPWKQGWMVTYKENEWDNEKLKIFVVPHSHNDPGWKFTVDEYYDRQSRHILDTIVESLSKVIFFFVNLKYGLGFI